MSEAPKTALATLVMRVVWMSALVGLGMQALTLTVGVVLGGSPTLAAAVIGAVGKVSWSTTVCAALAVGLAVPRASLPGTALWGLIAAPASFHLARAVQQALNAAAGLSAAAATPALVVWGTAGLKGAQYASLGLLLLSLNRRAEAPLSRYLGAGALTGLLFGGLLVGLGVSGGVIAPTALAIAPAAVNELVFPALCAGVVYLTTRAEALLGGERTS
ncbi:hypothetical protein L6R49_01760 [Myxococcota bacterium]|nr:hypothetical protein [Myxococcota bacterium]